MKVTPGIYRTRSGDKAHVIAVAPSLARLALLTCYAIGWIETDDGEWFAGSWSETGRYNETGQSDESDIVLTETQASAPAHEAN